MSDVTVTVPLARWDALRRAEGKVDDHEEAVRKVINDHLRTLLGPCPSHNEPALFDAWHERGYEERKRFAARLIVVELVPVKETA